MEQRLRAGAPTSTGRTRRLTAELKKLAERQKALVGQAETRLQDDREKIDEAESSRSPPCRSSGGAPASLRARGAGAGAELDAHGAERRRALEEMSQRLKARERQLAERVDREETDVVRRIQARFVDIERRQVEALERTMKQAAGRFAEASALQFDSAVKSARRTLPAACPRARPRRPHVRAGGGVRPGGAPRAGRGHGHAAGREAASPGDSHLERQRDEFIAELSSASARSSTRSEIGFAPSRRRRRRNGLSSTAGSRSSPAAQRRANRFGR